MTSHLELVVSNHLGQVQHLSFLVFVLGFLVCIRGKSIICGRHLVSLEKGLTVCRELWLDCHVLLTVWLCATHFQCSCTCSALCVSITFILIHDSFSPFRCKPWPSAINSFHFPLRSIASHYYGLCLIMANSNSCSLPLPGMWSYNELRDHSPINVLAKPLTWFPADIDIVKAENSKVPFRSGSPSCPLLLPSLMGYEGRERTPLIPPRELSIETWDMTSCFTPRLPPNVFGELTSFDYSIVPTSNSSRFGILGNWLCFLCPTAWVRARAVHEHVAWEHTLWHNLFLDGRFNPWWASCSYCGEFPVSNRLPLLSFTPFNSFSLCDFFLQLWISRCLGTSWFIIRTSTILHAPSPSRSSASPLETSSTSSPSMGPTPDILLSRRLSASWIPLDELHFSSNFIALTSRFYLAFLFII